MYTKQVSDLPHPGISRFWILWAATTLTNLADGIFKLALPLAAVRLTDSPALVAGVAFAIRLPWLLFALLSGVIVDRIDRRHTMFAANLTRFLLLALMVSMILGGMLSIPMLYLFALLLGINETLNDTASVSILPTLVEKEHLERANARLVGAITVTNEFIGPPLGGFLAGISLVLAFATSSVLYLGAAFALLLMAGSFRVPRTDTPAIWSELALGFHYVWGNALLRTLAIVVAVMNLCWSAWLSVIVLYVVSPGPGGLSETGYGFMLTSIGIGGFVGVMITVPVVQRLGRRTAVGADLLGTFLMLAAPAITANVWLIGGAAVIGGIGGSLWSIVVSSVRQQMVPDHMQGKTAGVYRLFGYGALPIGAAFAGIVAEKISIPAVFALCAVLTALLLIPFHRVLTAEALNADSIP
ncbi:MAG: MFS transporter [Anaerolineae bacterium]|nr:MFS transporter [Anaerolineae bacterium]